MSKYEDYKKEVEKLEGKDKLFADLMLDLRYTLNSIDIMMKRHLGIGPKKADESAK